MMSILTKLETRRHKYRLYDGPDALIANKLLELGRPVQSQNFSEGTGRSSTCHCKKGTLRAYSDISSASNLLCSACREHGQSFTCDISLIDFRSFCHI